MTTPGCTVHPKPIRVETLAEGVTRRHSWRDVRSIPSCESPDGCDRTERTCSNPGCGLVKITVHPPQGLAYRKWRHPNGNEFDLGSTPPCMVHGAPTEVAFQ
jgi:hypothetical protein